MRLKRQRSAGSAQITHHSAWAPSDSENDDFPKGPLECVHTLDMCLARRLPWGASAHITLPRLEQLGQIDVEHSVSERHAPPRAPYENGGAAPLGCEHHRETIKPRAQGTPDAPWQRPPRTVGNFIKRRANRCSSIRASRQSTWRTWVRGWYLCPINEALLFFCRRPGQRWQYGAR